MNGKRYLIIGVSAGTILICMLFILMGYEKTWRLWNIPTTSPCFADARVITSGLETKALGLDPLIDNPRDPWGRKMNYPRIWQMLYLMGVNQSQTVYFGITFAILFVSGIYFFTPSTISEGVAKFLILCVFSPAILLGVERGNNDLVIFFLLAVAIFFTRKITVLAITNAAGALLAAFLLKLFPLFGLGLFLSLKKKSALMALLLALVFVVVYGLATSCDLQLIRQATPQIPHLSYGIDVVWMIYGGDFPHLKKTLKLLCYIACCACFLLAFQRGCGQKFNEAGDADRDQSNINAFRVGSGIYVGTFLLGTNFDYRLVFLLFVIPQLVTWSKMHRPPISTVSRLTIMGILISVWGLIIERIISGIIPEISKWIIFYCLLLLLIASAPKWIKEMGATLFLSKRFRVMNFFL